MSNYYVPIDVQHKWIIYMKSVIPSKIEVDNILEWWDELFIGLKEEGLKQVFKDDKEVIDSIEIGDYPSLKVDGDITELCSSKYLMTYKDYEVKETVK